MKQSKNIMLTGVLAATLGLASATASADEGIYAGISGGIAMPAGDVADELENSQTWQLFGGQYINENLAIEGGYTNFGEMEVSEDSSYHIDFTGFEISPMAILPIGNRLSLFAKVGFIAWSSDFGTTDDDGVDVFYGAGANYLLSDNLSVRGAYNSYSLDDIDINLFSVSAVFQF